MNEFDVIVCYRFPHFVVSLKELFALLLSCSSSTATKVRNSLSLSICGISYYVDAQITNILELSPIKR